MGLADQCFSDSATQLLRDVITKEFVPNTGQLENLLSEIRSRLATPKEKRLKQILRAGDTPGGKPNHKLHHLRALMGSDLHHIVSDEVLVRLWIVSLESPLNRRCGLSMRAATELSNKWPHSPIR